ncbi:MAG: hypothetical protein NTX81_01870, partial [Candidatus Bathyarchaeota archaeon]|nr:hypothetical protein [Candidatus Bathyarchaeota archaeon]
MNQKYSFKQLLLQEDMFWTYVSSRRYWGSFRKALNDVGVDLRKEELIHEYDQEVDWWEFKDLYVQQEWLPVTLRCLRRGRVDVSPKGLKLSPYFDLYTDAVNYFGNYETALEIAGIPPEAVSKDSVGYPKNKKVFEKVIQIYLLEDIGEKCRLLKKRDLDTPVREMPYTLPENENRIVIVDGSNVGWRNGTPSLDNLKLVEERLISMGFQHTNVVFIFDASFRYKVGEDVFDKALSKDSRY